MATSPVAYNPNLPPTANQPTLLPNFDQPTQQGLTTVLQNPGAVLAANPRVAATNAVTIGGTIANGNVVTLNLTNPVFPNGIITVTATAITADTAEMVAERLSNALTAYILAMSQPIPYPIYGTVLGDVMTVNQLGPVGNFTVVTGSATGSITVTPATSGVMTGGTGPIMPLQNFTSQNGIDTMRFRAGQPIALLGYDVITDLVNSGSPIS